MNEGAREQKKELTAREVKERIYEYREIITKWRWQLEHVLEGRISVQRFVRVLERTLSAEPKLLLADTRSVLSAMLDCAVLNLEPGGQLQHCWIVPFDNWDRRRNITKTEAQVMIGYQGLRVLAGRADPDLYSIDVGAVREGDHFVHKSGLLPRLEHEAVAPEEQGDLTHAYAILRLKGIPPEQHPFRVIGLRDIERACAPWARKKHWSERSPAWKNHSDEMWIKTAVRKVLKMHPKQSVELTRAIQTDEQYETGNALDSWGIEVESSSVDIEPTQAALGEGEERPHVDVPEPAEPEPVPARHEPPPEHGSGRLV